jgi:hypothetical protein
MLVGKVFNMSVDLLVGTFAVPWKPCLRTVVRISAIWRRLCRYRIEFVAIKMLLLIRIPLISRM